MNIHDQLHEFAELWSANDLLVNDDAQFESLSKSETRDILRLVINENGQLLDAMFYLYGAHLELQWFIGEKHKEMDARVTRLLKFKEGKKCRSNKSLVQLLKTKTSKSK